MGKKQNVTVNETTATEVSAAEATTPEAKYNVVLMPADELAEPTQPDAPAEPSDAPTTKKGKRTRGNVTLADLAVRYHAQMEREQKSAGTMSSYGMELKTAMAALGAETPLDKITVKDVATFFESDRVMKLKSGKPKSQLSIDKTRRVLRLALVWAERARLIEKAPLPETPAK